MPDHSASRSTTHRRDPRALRTHTLRIAVTSAELDALRARAARHGQRLGPHLRACALAGSAQAAELIRLLAQMLATARGVAGNLNQASHRANVLILAGRESGNLDVDALEREQRAITSALGDIRHWMDDVRHVVAMLTGATRS